MEVGSSCALVVSVSIEIVQFAGRWVGNNRWTDVDDVIFNVAGALLGYLMLRLVETAAAWSRRYAVKPSGHT